MFNDAGLIEVSKPGLVSNMVSVECRLYEQGYECVWFDECEGGVRMSEGGITLPIVEVVTCVSVGD